MMISVIVTVRNEERNIRDLLDSLVIQEKPFEILVIDSNSTDATPKICKHYQAIFENIRFFVHGGTRGESRNFGIRNTRGTVVAFIDGDCIANPFWLKELRRMFSKGHKIVAGKTINIGYHAFEDLGRVELYHLGVDITYPSCNLAYDKALIEQLGGFDTTFRTAEDIDLNYRAVENGNKIAYNENAIVYHRTRGSFYAFLKQALWNGYGRKQLTLKHGSLWSGYRASKMFIRHINAWYLLRLMIAMLGYFAAKISIPKQSKKSVVCV